MVELVCFDRDCHRPVTLAEMVWLEDDNGDKYPFHPACADQPWPMSECDPPPAIAEKRRLSTLYLQWRLVTMRLWNRSLPLSQFGWR